MFKEEQKSFQNIFEEETGKRISEANTVCQGTHLLNLVKITLELNVNSKKIKIIRGVIKCLTGF
jgi:hypothetical protein